jgi:hypothetical protein
VIRIYTGTLGPGVTFSEVACDDDGRDTRGGARHTSRLDAGLTGGTTSFIEVSGCGDNEYGRLVFKLYLD